MVARSVARTAGSRLRTFIGGLRLGLLNRLLGQQLYHHRIRPRRLLYFQRTLCGRGESRPHRLRRLLYFQRTRCGRGGRGVVLDEHRDCRVALGLGVLQGGVAVIVEQLGVSLGSQQRVSACLVPSESGQHQGGGAVDVLQVGVGRCGGAVDFLRVGVIGRDQVQQKDNDFGVTVERSTHERGATVAVRQADARASPPQLPHHIQVAVGCGGVQQAEGCGSTRFR